eukprot:scaffold1581_cov127-Isochrysis_galbana.AAC.4
MCTQAQSEFSPRRMQFPPLPNVYPFSLISAVLKCYSEVSLVGSLAARSALVSIHALDLACIHVGRCRCLLLALLSLALAGHRWFKSGPRKEEEKADLWPAFRAESRLSASASAAAAAALSFALLSAAISFAIASRRTTCDVPLYSVHCGSVWLCGCVGRLSTVSESLVSHVSSHVSSRVDPSPPCAPLFSRLSAVRFGLSRCPRAPLVCPCPPVCASSCARLARGRVAPRRAEYCYANAGALVVCS